MSKRIILNKLSFTGPGKRTAALDFGKNLTVIWGASNTGKSFSVESIDFMLGAKRAPEPIAESAGYDNCWLELTLPKLGEVTLSRSMAGGDFALYTGHGIGRGLCEPAQILAAKHNRDRLDNLSAVLLDEIGLRDRLIATNSSGKTRPLSFRDLAKVYLGGESSIISTLSPIEGGQNTQTTTERSVFRLLLTGVDDSAIVLVDDPGSSKAAKSVRIELLDEMLSDLASEIGEDSSDALELRAQLARVEGSIDRINEDILFLQISIRDLLQEKQSLSRMIPDAESRLDEVIINLARFAQLQDVYDSDIARLESLEEAGFILGLTVARECSLCGAEPSAQRHATDHHEISLVQSAALAEMDRIRKQSKDLAGVADLLQREKGNLSEELSVLHLRLFDLEEAIERLVPQSSAHKSDLTEFIQKRDQIKYRLELLARREELLQRRSKCVGTIIGKKGDRLVFTVDKSAADRFAQTVGGVLEEWGFPGQHRVSFDGKKYDLDIDGKSRSANGKGVRAVTHAAFKVALLMYCRERNLPHPGFLILDTPLLTYRDPLKNSKYGKLDRDEVELSSTALKDRFYEHMASLRADAQIIVLENVDPPVGLESRAHVELFSGDQGRAGLF